MNTFKQFSESEDEDYRGNHQPSHEDGAPLHDLTVVYPDDVNQTKVLTFIEPFLMLITLS